MEGFDNLKSINLPPAGPAEIEKWRKEGYKEKCCPHDRCLNHSPEWEKLGDGLVRVQRLGPSLKDRWLNWLFYITVDLKEHVLTTNGLCCGNYLLHCIHVRTRYCKKCGRQDKERLADIEFCPCCGYKRRFVPGDRGYILGEIPWHSRSLSEYEITKIEERLNGLTTR